MSVTTPHFSAHFAFNNRGESTVVEQGSPEDQVAKAFNVAVCPIGFREDNLEYGIPELLFKTVPLDVTAVQQDIARWAEVDVSVLESEGGAPAFRNLLTEVG